MGFSLANRKREPKPNKTACEVMEPSVCTPCAMDINTELEARNIPRLCHDAGIHTL